jgi:hypothetical protein
MSDLYVQDGGQVREVVPDLEAPKVESWLGDLDSNQDCSVQSREFYR